jgi:pimeloyl-ACP methyl ester carboxylesterase
MPRKVLWDVVAYWRDRFDWRAAERRLNGLPQFTIEIDGRIVHYLHVKGVDQKSAPLVLTHGWPGSFVEMYKIIPMLTDPTSNGLPGFRSFDVIVPSLPGFGFSQAPVRPGTNSRAVASLWSVPHSRTRSTHLDEMWRQLAVTCAAIGAHGSPSFGKPAILPSPSYTQKGTVDDESL